MGCREVERGQLAQDPVEPTTHLLVVVSTTSVPILSWRATLISNLAVEIVELDALNAQSSGGLAPQRTRLQS
jgi:hypothetical protein